MHLLKSSLFVDQISACGNGNGDLCYVRNDHFEMVKVTVIFEAWSLENTTPRRIYEYTDSLEAGSIDWFELPYNFTSDTQVILVQLKVYHDHFDSSNPTISESIYLKDMPKNIKGLHNPVNIEIVDIRINRNGDGVIVLKSNKLALFVVLTTRAEGIFAENCIGLRPLENRVSMSEQLVAFVDMILRHKCHIFSLILYI